MNDKLEAFRKRLKERINWKSRNESATAWLAQVISSTTAFFSQSKFRNLFRRQEKEEADWQPWVLERPKTKEAVWKSRIGSPTAWLALIISSTTAFFSLIYHSDRLSVVVPSLVIGYNDTEIEVPKPGMITFINSGTRPIALLEVTMAVVELAQATAGLPCDGAGVQFPIRFEETVVKPDEAVVKELSFFNNQPKVSFPREGSKNPDRLVVPAAICLTFAFVATDTPILRKAIAADHRWARKDSSLAEMFQESARDKQVKRIPQYLIKRNTFRTEVNAN